MRSVRGTLISAVVGTLTMLGASGCSSPDRGDGVVVIASGADLESGNPLVTIHPLSRQLQRHALFVTLFRLDSTLQPVSYAARSWLWSPDRKSLTINLARGLKWHDGEPFTASDVEFTFKSLKDPLIGSPRAADGAMIRSVVISDSAAVRFQFDRPQPAVPLLLSELPIVPRHLLDTVPGERWRSNAFATSPVGSGPFRFVSRQQGRRWEFARNDSFPEELGGPPLLKRLIVAVVDEAATKFAGLVSGDLDMAGVSPSMAHLVERDSLLRLLTPPVLFSQVIAFNTRRPPFDDQRVRQAVSLALDRSRMIKAAVAGYAVPAIGAIPPGLPFSSANESRSYESVSSDLRADSLLDAAGWIRSSGSAVRTRSGHQLRATLLTAGGGDLAVEQLIQADLAKRGIAVDIRVMEMVRFLETVRAPDKERDSGFDMAVTGIPGDMALGHLAAMFATAQSGGALDYTGYHSGHLDSLLNAARNSPPDSAGPAWHNVDVELERVMPVAWLYHARGVQGLSRRLRNVKMDLRGELVSVAQWYRE